MYGLQCDIEKNNQLNYYFVIHFVLLYAANTAVNYYAAFTNSQKTDKVKKKKLSVN